MSATRSLTLLGCVALTACTSLGLIDGDKRFTGVIERKQEISRAGEPSPLLMGFGLLGGLAYAGASAPTPTNLYFVKTASGDVVTVQVDEEWAVGSCVHVIPMKDALGGGSYAYGQARITAAEKCAAATPAAKD